MAREGGWGCGEVSGLESVGRKFGIGGNFVLGREVEVEYSFEAGGKG
jgi:hypothetical protein